MSFVKNIITLLENINIKGDKEWDSLTMKESM